tara:strand:+ start:585 stop:1001 length:417 start_codon:yes stop_codon:yes gene_type:complete
MAQNEIVGRADGLFSSYNNLRVNTDGSINTNNTDPIRSVIIYEASLSGGGANSPAFDLTGARRVRIYGNTDNTSFLMVQYAMTLVDGVYDWQFIDQLNPLTINGNVVVNKVIEVPPNYLRFENTGGTHQISFRIIVEK